MTELPPLVPLAVVAKHFHVNTATVRAWVKQGLIPKDAYIHVGSLYRFNLPKVLEALTRKDIEDDPSKATWGDMSEEGVGVPQLESDDDC
tara:strand:+ start:133 stop:402 length:270 start_codon:yes stop_codon:yes gene_type:complete